MTRRVGVVGSGVSGLVAAYVLARDARVTLYEADERLGGHADTHLVDGLAVDSGFIVHNTRTYPLMTRLFDELGVATQESEMSMSVRDEDTGLEYAGARGLRGLFCSPRSLADPRLWRMYAELPGFHRAARRLLETGDDQTTFGTFLDRGGYSAYFRRHFATALVACVWSCDPEHALDYPARSLFTFLENHGMLSLMGSPTWRTVAGGSREYVARVAERLPDVRAGTKVVDVREGADGVVITDNSGRSETYDAVVLAAHPGEALAMLAEPTPAQREVLGALRYSDNLAQLHTDTSVLPRHAPARASWNYLRRSRDDGRVVVTYDITRLMRLPARNGTRYLVTLNGADVVDPARVLATREYAHPIYDAASVAAQRRLPQIATERIAFAGAYHGWGFHEDGARSGLRAAEHLGGSWPAREPHRLPRTPALYETTIQHVRTSPLRHAFRYRSYSWLVDLDRLPNRGPLASFEARDHVGDPTRSIRENIASVLAEHGVDLAAPRILMLAQARVLGYVFNPISAFWCYDSGTGELTAVVVEVHNTYGGRHAYVVRPDQQGRASVPKALYVSPFNDTSGSYDVIVPPPGDRCRIVVRLNREGHDPFVATLTGVRRDATRRAVWSASLRMPLEPLVNAARIRYQGIGLWLRRLPVQPRPPAADVAGHTRDHTHRRGAPQ